MNKKIKKIIKALLTGTALLIFTVPAHSQVDLEFAGQFTMMPGFSDPELKASQKAAVDSVIHYIDYVLLASGYSAGDYEREETNEPVRIPVALSGETRLVWNNLLGISAGSGFEYFNRYKNTLAGSFEDKYKVMYARFQYRYYSTLFYRLNLYYFANTPVFIDFGGGLDKFDDRIYYTLEDSENFLIGNHKSTFKSDGYGYHYLVEIQFLDMETDGRARFNLGLERTVGTLTNFTSGKEVLINPDGKPLTVSNDAWRFYMGASYSFTVLGNRDPFKNWEK